MIYGASIPKKSYAKFSDNIDALPPDAEIVISLPTWTKEQVIKQLVPMLKVRWTVDVEL